MMISRVEYPYKSSSLKCEIGGGLNRQGCPKRGYKLSERQPNNDRGMAWSYMSRYPRNCRMVAREGSSVSHLP
jgi:hypothetical protein